MTPGFLSRLLKGPPPTVRVVMVFEVEVVKFRGERMAGSELLVFRLRVRKVLP
jgi:hypothetical protein